MVQKGLVVALGQRFGSLTVVDHVRAPNTPGQVKRGCVAGIPAALCQCDCGEFKTVRLHHLCSGVQISCGCQGVQRRSMARAGRPSDLRTHHYLYDTHRQMMLRCYSSTHPTYERYGGWGIKVAAEWHDSLSFCRALDELLGERLEGYTLDRIDNDGNYEPGNVRWASYVQQAANRRERRP